MACDRQWELYVLLDTQGDAEVTKQFSRTVRADGFFCNMVRQIWNRSKDGTLIQYSMVAKLCQGCEPRYVQGKAHGKYPLAAETKYKLSHCTCGLTKANITWALTNDIFVDAKRKN